MRRSASAAQSAPHAAAIFAGFLLEALAMTLAGGLVGILAAWAVTKIALFIPQIPGRRASTDLACHRRDGYRAADRRRSRRGCLARQARGGRLSGRGTARRLIPSGGGERCSTGEADLSSRRWLLRRDRCCRAGWTAISTAIRGGID
jgi:hypothetical protein